MSGMRKWVRALAAMMLSEHRTPARVAAAIFVGAIIGCSPLYGLHLGMCLGLSLLLGLNFLIVYGAAHVSTPPLIPFVGAASIQIGERILHGRFLAMDRDVFRHESVRVLMHRFFKAWLVGGTVLGAALGIVVGGIAWVVLAYRKPPPPDPLDDAIELARRRYDREPGRFKWYARMKYVMDPCYRAIASRISPGAFTVDLGTGLGMLPILLGLLGHGRTARGIEWDQKKAEAGARAAAGLDGVEVLVGDAREVVIPACDAITLVDVLHYYDVETQRALLARCVASLNAGGTLLVREGDGARKGSSMFTRLGESIVTKLGWNRGPAVKFRPIADLEADLRALNLSVSQDEVAGKLHPGNVLLIARCPEVERRS